MEIMDYKEKYEEIIKNLKEARKTKGGYTFSSVVDEIIPELKGSEDERIRKEIIKCIKTEASGYPEQMRNKWIAWLEKQGEQKSNPYSGVSFEYNGHIWGMCARDYGVDILLDKQPFKHLGLEKQCEQESTDDLNRETKGDEYMDTCDPTCQLNNLHDNIKLPFKAKVKSSGDIVTIHSGQLSMSGKEWIKYQSDGDDGYKGYKPDELELVYEVEQNQVNEVETRFRVGDWIITPNNETKQIEKITHGNYRFTDKTCYNIIDVDNKSHLWTIKDAKDGDVLATHLSPEGDWIGIYKESVDILGFKTHCFLNAVGEFVINPNRCRNHGTHGLHPATKEQHDLLFSAMKEAGYEWDYEKKELKKIEQKTIWSEEDEKFLNLSLVNLTELKDRFGDCIDWLKSIKKKNERRII